jgi:cleavage and polyadenylation specificity factor subunit 1
MANNSTLPSQMQTATFIFYNLILNVSISICSTWMQCFRFLTFYHCTDPKSLHGKFLLQRSTFSLGGHLASTMTLVPRTYGLESATSSSGPDSMEVDPPALIHQILITTSSGSIATLTPLTEPQYRRLSTLSSQLVNAFDPPCGLNPRAFRGSNVAAGAEVSIGGARQVVDGALVQKWMLLGAQRRGEILARLGVEAEDVTEDLERVVSARGLGFL